MADNRYWSREEVLRRPGWGGATIGAVGQLQPDLVHGGTRYYLRSHVREWERTQILHLRRRNIQGRWDARRTHRASTGLAELDRALTQLREDEANEKRAEEERRAALVSKWTEIAPVLSQAISLVNEMLSKHGYTIGIEIEAPRFNDPTGDAYGAQCCIRDVRDGNFIVVLSGTELYVHHSHGGHWSEGYTVPIRGATVAPITRAIAETTKWIITEQPGS